MTTWHALTHAIREAAAAPAVAAVALAATASQAYADSPRNWTPVC